MNRPFAIAVAAVAAAVAFAGLVYAVLVAADVSESAAITVQGLTLRRLWATMSAVLGLAGVVIGWLALARPAGRFGIGSKRSRAIAALAAGGLANLLCRPDLLRNTLLGGALFALLYVAFMLALRLSWLR